MDVSTLVALLVGFFAIAALYSSVGHAGASGYLALMALASVAPETMRPTALTLNILVAGLTVVRFQRAGRMQWKGLWPFLLGSVPLAALGGSVQLPHVAYYLLVGLVLLAAACALLWRAKSESVEGEEPPNRVRPMWAVPMGGGIGLLSGLTGTGGGIFLSPAILLLGWAGPRATAAIAAPFILLNSGAALLAGTMRLDVLPPEMPLLVCAVIGGALVGTWLVLKRLSRPALLMTLALVEVLASTKLFLMVMA